MVMILSEKAKKALYSSEYTRMNRKNANNCVQFDDSIEIAFVNSIHTRMTSFHSISSFLRISIFKIGLLGTRWMEIV